MKKIEILDTTLRDGAQSEGISFSLRDKLNIIERLSRFGVDFIEAGNPASNPKDIEVFEKAKLLNLGHSQLVAFGSTSRKDNSPETDNGINALLAAGTKFVSVFGKSHASQVGSVLRVTLDENLSMIRRTIEHLKGRGREVIFDAEHFFDGYKSDKEYALSVLKTAKKAGAINLILCDTNGGCFPDEITEITKAVTRCLSPSNCDIIGIHCHDDTGCAVANTIAAVKSSATHVQGTFIGIGERCGNANLSAVIPNLQLKLGYLCVEPKNMEGITETARFIGEVANVRLPRNMPYVGGAAFSHKGGMHIDGVMKSPESFEHIPPEKVGNERNLLLSEMSGRGTLLQKLNAIGRNLTIMKNDPIVEKLTNRVKELEHKGYQFEAADASFELLVLQEMGLFKPHFKILEYNIVSSLSKACKAKVRISAGEYTEETEASGNGPVNALDMALRKALEVFYPELSAVKLSDYKVRIINGDDNTAAITRVLMESGFYSGGNSGTTWTTVGAGDNIISASMVALVDSLEYALQKFHNFL
ncbi:MAG: citramalate synthase [Oscillospiraceae bacterium]|nr:citramalate synthase [Oscillospiraceae bacterium]